MINWVFATKTSRISSYSVKLIAFTAAVSSYGQFWQWSPPIKACCFFFVPFRYRKYYILSITLLSPTFRTSLTTVITVLWLSDKRISKSHWIPYEKRRKKNTTIRKSRQHINCNWLFFGQKWSNYIWFFLVRLCFGLRATFSRFMSRINDSRQKCSHGFHSLLFTLWHLVYVYRSIAMHRHS